MNPLSQPRELYYWLIDILDTARDLPYDAGVILRELRKGRIKIEFEHMGLEPIRQTMERMANRQSLTNIIVALLISSSVIALARIPPFVGNISLLGVHRLYNRGYSRSDINIFGHISTPVIDIDKLVILS